MCGLCVSCWVRNWRTILVLGLLGGAAFGAGKPGAPVASIALEPLGFTGFAPQYLLSGLTMYTVHFVDGGHVLLTFNSKSLMARLPDTVVGDDDRTVQALLLEVPSGKVLAKTLWRTRDRQQYLWPLGHGQFLKRVRTRLVVIEPMKNLEAGEAFKETPFLDARRPVGFISVSPGGDLLTVETVPLPHRAEGDVTLVNSAEDDLAQEMQERDRKVPVQVHFYRLAAGKAPQFSGLVYSPALVNVPATSEGYLDIKKESTGVYDFDFKTHDGKRTELAAYDSSCVPRPYFVSRSEFIAFGCRGSADKVEWSGFNLRGEEPWVGVFNEQFLGTAIVPAPSAGRFALSRLTVSAQTLVDPDALTADAVTGQEISVLQTHDGRFLMKIQSSPAQRAGQNFDLSDDGLELVTVRGGNLEVYRLPELTAKDKVEVARATENVPEKSVSEILLDSQPVTRRAQAKAEGVKVGAEVMQESAGEVVPPPVREEPGNMVGDVPGQRKAPSLYGADYPKPK